MDLPLNNGEYKRREYWDERYKNEEKYDWFTAYSAFKELVVASISPNDKILMLGSGNSSLSEDLYRDGFHHITNMDYSSVVIENMREKCRDLHHMTWDVMDLAAMTYPHHSFDVVMEKGTLDALLVDERDIWTVSQETQDLMHHILMQVSGILRHGGRFISITFADPFFRRALFARKEYDWSITTQTFGETFHFYYIIMNKGHSLTESDQNLRSKFVERHKVTPQTILVDRTPLESSDSEDEEFLFNVDLHL